MSTKIQKLKLGNLSLTSYAKVFRTRDNFLSNPSVLKTQDKACPYCRGPISGVGGGGSECEVLPYINKNLHPQGQLSQRKRS